MLNIRKYPLRIYHLLSRGVLKNVGYLLSHQTKAYKSYLGKNIVLGHLAVTDISLPFQLHNFLKRTYFNNSAGDHVFVDENKSSEAQYTIINYLFFLNDTEAFMKVGQFVPKAPLGQDFTICEDATVWDSSWDSKVRHI